VEEVQQTLTPEQQKAMEDSLRNAQLRELKIIRSFAYSHYQNKNYADAAKYYAELAQKDTGRMFNDYGLWAQSLIKLNLPADSVKKVYQMGIEAFPGDAYLHASLGHIYRTQGLLEDAVKEYEAAVQYKPEEIAYKKTLAELYVRVDRPLDAIELYRKIVEAEPENKSAAETLASLVKTHLSPEEYVKSLQDAIKKFPNDLEKRFELAQAYINVSENRKTLEQLDEILQLDPTNARALRMKGDVQQNLRNYDGAIQAYKKVLEHESDPEVMVELSNVYREQGKYIQARKYARQALSQDPKMGAAYVAQARIYETAADKKTGGKLPGYKDKLVFLIAYGLYRDAVNSGDYSVMDQAKIHMTYLKDSKLIPDYADWFMHQKDRDPTTDPGYSWINPDWPELKYINTYLDNISNK
jgi:tetratricopeptide (TPR) repeat protein